MHECTCNAAARNPDVVQMENLKLQFGINRQHFQIVPWYMDPWNPSLGLQIKRGHEVMKTIGI